jgi:DNA polymerase (family 10)
MTTQHRFTNREIADILAGVAARLQILDANRFRIIAFQNAAESIRNLAQDINAIDAAGELTTIQGVGKGIGDAIHRCWPMAATPSSTRSAQVPQGVVDMMQVPDMGPKKAKRLWEELGIDSVAALRAAAEAGQLRDLKGFGAKSEEKILKGIELLAKRAARAGTRTPIGAARPLALGIIAGLQARCRRAPSNASSLAGSLRRWKETIGDVDILCVSATACRGDGRPSAPCPKWPTLPAAGETKSAWCWATACRSICAWSNRKHWGAALQYFTGSKEHNVAVRELALKQGWSLNEYGLTATGDGAAPAGEQRFFRRRRGSLRACWGWTGFPRTARKPRRGGKQRRDHELPALITWATLQGELHGHTTWSDGAPASRRWRKPARARGYRYWSVSDHSIGLGIVQGVDAEKLARQRAEIDAYNNECAAQGIDFRLLQGSEVEILADGELGLTDDVLATLDVVVASIHSAQRQDRETITARCLKAVYNPHVDILGHPTGRLIGARPPTELDVERVLHACLETGTVVEINANPERLDLNDVYARRAVELGCKIAINCDAHALDGMAIVEYGIGTARRGWVTAADVVNTRPLDEMLRMLKDRRG